MKAPSKNSIRDISGLLGAMAQMETSELGASVVPREEILSYKLIPVELLKGESKREALRINSLIDLFYFEYVILQKTRYQLGPSSLHRNMCLSVMKDGLKEVIEIPRAHFKSTVYSEGFPMWRALPFGPREEDLFDSLGYSSLYIEWMHRAHNQNIRILLISETIKNSMKLGVRVSKQYENNDRFRYCFPEILPSSKETWTIDSMEQKRTQTVGGNGEGTYDFIGVGAALQSRHYDLIIQDDLVGREAINSDVTMQKTIEYHQLLVGATDSDPDNPARDFDELVVGNRWSHKDLNSYIRAEEPYFNFSMHSALGGCCELHPVGLPIFPESFSLEKLLRWKRRLGTYYFSCQFLNFPIDPSKAKFNMGDFRYFHFEHISGALATPKSLATATPHQKRAVIRHHVYEGDVIKDVFPRHLDRFLIVDPNHGGSHNGAEVGKQGRCRHAAIVSGVSRDPRRIYFLDMWAEACSIGDFVEQIFHLAIKWKLDKIYVEAVGAQKYLIYHLDYYKHVNRLKYPQLSNIRILPLKTPQNEGAKAERIDSIIPLVERHEIWLNAGCCQKFQEEAEAWGQKKGLIDLLDVAGYGLQVWNFDTVDEEELEDFFNVGLNRWKRGMASLS